VVAFAHSSRHFVYYNFYLCRRASGSFPVFLCYILNLFGEVMKKKIVLNLFFAFLLFLILEIFLKTFFLVSFSAMELKNTPIVKKLIKTKGLLDAGGDLFIRFLFEWDRDLNYKPRGYRFHGNRFKSYHLSTKSRVLNINEDGFRDPPMNTLKAIAIEPNKKIICLGDSWTMGQGVDSEFSYPAQLQKLLDRNSSEKKFHVFNMGVMSYTSFQGVRLLKRMVSFLKPGDIVIIGYNSNDERPGFSVTDAAGDKVFANEAEFNSFVFHPEKGCTSIRLLRLLVNLFFNQSKKPISFWEFKSRVGYKEYYANIATMIKLARSRGIMPILFYHGRFSDHNYIVKALYGLSESTHTPIVDVYDVMKKLEKTVDRERGKCFLNIKNIASSFTGIQNDLFWEQPVKITFRLHLSQDFVQSFLKDYWPQSIELNLFDDYSEKTKAFLLNDSGVDGDESAGDDVWSGTVAIKPSPKALKFSPVYKNGKFQREYDILLFFFFRVSASKGEKEIVFSEHTRPTVIPKSLLGQRFLVIGKIKNIDRDTPNYSDLITHRRPILFYQNISSPVFFFGNKSLRSDFMHPTEIGYRIFAQEIYKVINQGMGYYVFGESTDK
jgi:lysophospholipase L1-like esterase